MSTDAGAALTAVVGLVLTRLALDGSYRRYVRPGMGPWLTVAGVLLTLLGLTVLWRHHRGQPDPSAPDHTTTDHTTTDHTTTDHADHHHTDPGTHGHGSERVAWLLLAPVLALLLVAPGALGAFSLNRTGSVATVRPGGGVFAPLTPGTEPHPMTLIEFDQRAFEGTGGASFNGATVRLVGFVGPARGDGFVVARYSIACCAADALAATALVTGWAGPFPARDAWVEVVGHFEPGDEVNPRLAAASVTVVPTPDDPYE